MPSRGFSAVLLSFFAASHRSRWHWAQSTFGAPATFWWGVTLSMISLWQATHSILACTLLPYLSVLTACSARFSPSAGTSSLPFLPSWQVWQVALSSFCETAGALAAAAMPPARDPARQTVAAASHAANLLVGMIFISNGGRFSAPRLALRLARVDTPPGPFKPGRKRRYGISATESTAQGCSALPHPWSRCSCALLRCRLRA
jgi:hypothetical protein